MIRKKSKPSIFIMSIGMFFIIGAIDNKPILEDMNNLQIIQTNLLVKITKQYKDQKLETERILTENESLKKETLRVKKVLKIMDFYRQSGMLNTYYWITPEYLYKLLSYREKYSELTKDYFYSTFDPEDFFLLWVANETHGNPSPDLIVKNKYGTKDYWLMMMNQCHYNERNPKKNYWRRVEVLYPHLKKQPDSSVEKNIAVWSMWLGEEKHYTVWRLWNGYRKHTAWKVREDIVKLFYILKQVKG